MEFDVLVNLVLNSLSIVLGLVTVGLVLGSDRERLAKRVSIRFTLAIAWVDVLKAASIIAYTFWETDGWSCQLVAFLLAWGVLAYMLLNGMLALNLYLVYVRGRVFSEKWTKFYFLGALGMATMLSTALLAQGALGWNVTNDTCAFRDEVAATQVVIFGCFFSWILLVCTFNSVIICLALFKLRSDKCKGRVVCQRHGHIRSLVFRV
ncbi:hypothetical protein DSO57_1019773 [Entomophthora muscae]|uniref:Uncharacterized protein n=1 Tax=Entomophthora muscae TaxID=34485 RepID=A0ACC2TEZ5_9FUNG|nr:hypothetical protein DSO57_1019773 [Entomophthora muscae]